jgi:hypothetical protein
MKVTVLLIVRMIMGVLDPSMNVFFPLGMHSGHPGGTALAASARRRRLSNQNILKRQS